MTRGRPEPPQCDGAPAVRFLQRRAHLESDGLGDVLEHLMRCVACERAAPGISEAVRFDLDIVRRAARIDRTRRVCADDIAVLTAARESLDASGQRGLGRAFEVFLLVLDEALMYHADITRHADEPLLSVALGSLVAGGAGDGRAPDARRQSVEAVTSLDGRIVVEIAALHDDGAGARALDVSVKCDEPGEANPVVACVLADPCERGAEVATAIVLRGDGGTWCGTRRITLPGSWRAPRLLLYRMAL